MHVRSFVVLAFAMLSLIFLPYINVSSSASYNAAETALSFGSFTALSVFSAAISPPISAAINTLFFSKPGIFCFSTVLKSSKQLTIQNNTQMKTIKAIFDLYFFKKITI